MRRETPRILHVTESMGGGTAAAIVEFVRSTPQFEHHLLFRRRAGSDVPVRHEDLFAGSRDAGGGPVGSPGRCARRCPPSRRASCTCTAPGPA